MEPVFFLYLMTSSLLDNIPKVRRNYALQFFAALVVVLLVVSVFGGSIYA